MFVAPIVMTRNNYLCPVCTKNIKRNDKTIKCISCKLSIHFLYYSYLTLEEFDNLSNPTINTWHCPCCTAKSLPFSELSDIDLIINNSNTINNCESILNNSPNMQFQELIDNCNNMSLQNHDVDDDSGELFSTSINSKYYSIDDINTIKADPTSSFNIIHTNIVSIDKHFDELSLTIFIGCQI